MNYLKSILPKELSPIAKNIGIKDLFYLQQGKVSQDTITKLIRNVPQEKIINFAENLKNFPDIVDKIKKIAPNIKKPDEKDFEKLKFIAKKLDIPDNDIEEIKKTMGTDVKQYIIIDDFNKISNQDVDDDSIPLEESPKQKINKIPLPNISDEEIANKLLIIKRTIKKAEKGYKISQEDKDTFDRLVDELKNIDDNHKDKEELDKYLNKIDDNLNINNDITMINDNPINNKTTIIEFGRIASLFRMCLVIMITICIFIYIITAALSIINVIYLLLKIINTILSLFYNTVLTNDQTLSYSAKQIIKSTKTNYKYDIFNILAEQQTALTIFNSVIYIIYILMAYVITYILCVIYVQIMRYTHILNGKISDIDVKYQILTIIGILFIFSILHLLIYKFLFKNVALSNFKTCNKFEKDVDDQINNIIETKYNNNTQCSVFFDLLSDTSKRNELDTLFSNKVKTIKTDTQDNIRKYLMMYNIYMYFEEYIYMNDVMKEKIKRYFGISSKEEEQDAAITTDITFIGLLDSNERKLMKVYHEDLQFHNLISKDYLEDYQKINEEILLTVNNINNYIIKYSGTFFPFLITCIYIFIICFYNIYTLYILFQFIKETENDNIFISIIYKFGNKYIYYCDWLYSLFFNK